VTLAVVAGCTGGGSNQTPGQQHAKTTPSASHASTSKPQADGPIRPGTVLVHHADLRADRPPYSEAVSTATTDDEFSAIGTTTIDALHYGLDLRWNSGARRLTGTETLIFRAPQAENQIDLDLGPAMHTTSAKVDGHPVTPTHSGYVLTIATGPLKANSHHVLVITYAGTPTAFKAPRGDAGASGGGFQIEPDGEVWTLQEPVGALTWYPVNDEPSDKAFYDITWHTQSNWTGVSTGQLTADSVHNGVRTTHWALDSPTASYLTTAAIGPYDEYSQTGPHGLPLTYWVRPTNRGALKTLRKSPQLLAWLEQRLGKFPFNSLGDVVIPAYSAVETQTLVTMGAPILHLPNPDASLLHEYVHQWYGDEVTPTGFKDLWMNETFAYYLQLTWEASHSETTTKQWHAMVDHEDQQLRTKYGPPGDPSPKTFAAMNVYACGARMLARLQTMLSAATFARLIRDWPGQHRFGNADRQQWVSYLDKVSGKNLTGFANTWLLSTTSPT
jgi:aminopeptidase N